MFKKVAFSSLTAALLTISSFAGEADPFDVYDWVAALEGEWVLSPAEKQTGTESYKDEAVLPLAGSNAVGISFKQIGRDSTVQEDLLPGTSKRMVTMYHCSDVDCSNIKATHYCIKLNQPELLANLEESTPTRIVFDCDMTTSVCQSDEDHVHQIIHELSGEGNHLKTSYLSWKEKKPIENSSIYHFDRKKESFWERLFK